MFPCLVVLLLLRVNPVLDYLAAFLLGTIYLLVFLSPLLLLIGLGIFLIRLSTSGPEYVKSDRDATYYNQAPRPNTEVVNTFSKKRCAVRSAHSLPPLKAKLGVLVAVVALLIYCIIDLSRWLARQWRKHFISQHGPPFF